MTQVLQKIFMPEKLGLVKKVWLSKTFYKPFICSIETYLKRRLSADLMLLLITL